MYMFYVCVACQVLLCLLQSRMPVCKAVNMSRARPTCRPADQYLNRAQSPTLDCQYAQQHTLVCASHFGICTSRANRQETTVSNSKATAKNLVDGVQRWQPCGAAESQMWHAGSSVPYSRELAAKGARALAIPRCVAIPSTPLALRDAVPYTSAVCAHAGPYALHPARGCGYVEAAALSSSEYGAWSTDATGRPFNVNNCLCTTACNSAVPYSYSNATVASLFFNGLSKNQ